MLSFAGCPRSQQPNILYAYSTQNWRFRNIAFGKILLSFSWLFLFLNWGKTPQISFSNFLWSFFFKFLSPIFCRFLLISSILSNLLIAVNFFLQFSHFFSLPTLAWRFVSFRWEELDKRFSSTSANVIHGTMVDVFEIRRASPTSL